MWPDGHLRITEVTKRPLTAGTLFKNSIVALVDKLACKVSGLPVPLHGAFVRGVGLMLSSSMFIYN